MPVFGGFLVSLSVVDIDFACRCYRWRQVAGIDHRRRGSLLCAVIGGIDVKRGSDAAVNRIGDEIGQGPNGGVDKQVWIRERDDR